jgi:hypothetical protein
MSSNNNNSNNNNNNNKHYKMSFVDLPMRNVKQIDVSVMSLQEVQEEERHLHHSHQQLYYQSHQLGQ